MVAPYAYAVALEVWFSFSDARIGSDGTFVGLANYHFLFEFGPFWQMIGNTLVFSGLGTLAKAALGLVMALALIRPFPGRRLVYAGLFLPFIFPIVLGTIAWYFLLSNVHGGLDWLLQQAGLITQPVEWKGSHALLSVTVVSVWHGTALFGVLLLAALRSVPTDMLEAAAVDGANRLRQFLDVILPHLVPAFLLGAILSVLGNFGDFAIVELLTRGGPLGQSQIASTYAFENALVSGDLSIGAAVALVMVPVYLAALVVAFRLLGRE